MCDTNVILDVLLDRSPFVADSYQVLKLCEERKVEGYITASNVTDIFYLVRKHVGNAELAYQALEKVLEIFGICNVTVQDIALAYQKRAKDFEDCLVAVCAKVIQCDCVVTRNQKDFAGLGIPALNPGEFLELQRQ